MEKRGKTKVGVVSELNGKYWGILHEDGKSCIVGFGGIDTATMSNPEYCLRPEDMTYERDFRRKELSKATLRKVSRTAIFTFEDEF